MNDTAFSLTQHAIHVLLVDDQEIMAQFVMRALVSESAIQFRFCQDPTQALNQAIQFKPTVILQDLVMPKVDGLTLVRQFRDHPVTCKIPIIVLTATDEVVSKVDAFSAGANDYMVKPFQKLELLARIRYHSQSYITLLERDEAFHALRISQRQLELKNRFIRNIFGRYLSDEIVDSILDTPEGLHLGGEKQVVTLMMADLRGFTAISEKWPPESVVRILNLFLEQMTDIIMQFNGTIDEIIGDAILVIFGAPVQRVDDARRAVACALEMQCVMPLLNQSNRTLGFPELGLGIGINTGPVVVGNIGSMKRAKYGVVGLNVNLTARIESCTIAGQILIAETTRQAVGPGLHLVDQMEIQPKGVSSPIMIHEVDGLGGEYNLTLNRPQIQWTECKVPLEVQFNIMISKFVGHDVFAGQIMALSSQSAQIRSDARVERFDNIKLSLFDGHGVQMTSELYAKVTHVDADQADRFVCVFTAVPFEARRFVTQCLTDVAS